MSLPDAIAAPRVSQRNTATPVAEANFYNSPLAQQLTTQYGEKFTLQTGPVLLRPSGSALPSACSGSHPRPGSRARAGWPAGRALGAWLGIAGGAWLIIGPQLATFLDVGSTGTPTGTSDGVIALERLFYFYAIGAAILLVAAVALGRLSVRSVGDVRAARRREAATAESPAAERAAAQPVTPGAPAPATTAAQPAATAGSAARGDVDANRQHHRSFGFMPAPR